MKSLTISFDPPKININGTVFDVLRSDAEIIGDMLDIDANLKKTKGTRQAFEEKRKALLAYLDTLLGEGAGARLQALAEEMTGGKGLGAASAEKVCELIITAAGKAYADAFKVSYGEEC